MGYNQKDSGTWSNLIPGANRGGQGSIPPCPDWLGHNPPPPKIRNKYQTVADMPTAVPQTIPDDAHQTLTIDGTTVRVMPEPGTRMQRESSNNKPTPIGYRQYVTIGGESVGVAGTEIYPPKPVTARGLRVRGEGDGYLTIGGKRIPVRAHPNHADIWEQMVSLFGVEAASVIYATIRKGLYRSKIGPHNPLSDDAHQFATVLVLAWSKAKQENPQTQPLGLVRVRARGAFGKWTRGQVGNKVPLYATERAECAESVEDIRKIGNGSHEPIIRTTKPRANFRHRQGTTVGPRTGGVDFREDWILETYNGSEGTDRTILRMLYDGCTMREIAVAIGSTREDIVHKVFALQRSARREYAKAV